MMLCIMLLPYDWLIAELHEFAGVQVFLLKWTVSVHGSIKQGTTSKPSIGLLGFREILDN